MITSVAQPTGTGALIPRKRGGGVKVAYAVLVFVSLVRHPASNAKAQATPPAAPNQSAAISAPLNSSKPAANPSDVSLVIRGPTNVVKVGDEIPVEFILSNHGTADYKYTDRNYDRGGRMGEYELVAKTASGQSVPDARLHFQPGRVGGLGQPRLLRPGESFSKVIALNLWALIKEPGQYEVMGIYGYDPGYSTSDPISITVLPRTKAEMHDYIQGLTNDVGPPGMSEDLVRKLMYTCSPEIVPILLKVMSTEGGNAKFWATVALGDYVPHTEGSRKAIVEAATKYGLNGTGLEDVLLANEFEAIRQVD